MELIIMMVGVNMSKPVAVLISDIHFSLNTLELASQSLLKAQFKAAWLKIPLVICGDLMDTKANMRAEVVNKLIEMFSVKDNPDTIILVGNHDLCNEKGKPHSLNFLKPYATIIEEPKIADLNGMRVGMIPYYSDSEELKKLLKYQYEPEGDWDFKNCKVVFMHQGLISTNSGHYIQDKSAITKEDVAGLRVISGHYHTRQTIDLPDGGKWDFLGNPFTLNYGEASDPEKGFSILMSDGSLEFVSTNLRKHVVIDNVIGELVAIPYVHKPGDLLWFKLRGTKEELTKTYFRELIAANYGINEGFKLDLIPTDTKTQAPQTKLHKGELLDSLIDSLTNTTDERKIRLKDMWKNLCE